MMTIEECDYDNRRCHDGGLPKPAPKAEFVPYRATSEE
jgi:hypothetical protein